MLRWVGCDFVLPVLRTGAIVAARQLLSSVAPRCEPPQCNPSIRPPSRTPNASLACPVVEQLVTASAYLRLASILTGLTRALTSRLIPRHRVQPTNCQKNITDTRIRANPKKSVKTKTNSLRKIICPIFRTIPRIDRLLVYGVKQGVFESGWLSE